MENFPEGKFLATVKLVKDGYEGLLSCDTQRLNGVTLSDATIDNIIVHLEKANEEKRHG